MALRTVSVLRPVQWIPVNRLDSMYKSTIKKLVEIAQNDLPGMDLTVRDLLPSDLPGFTNNEFVEQSGTDNQWAATTGGDGTAIANETFLALTGFSVLTPRAHDEDHVVTAMRTTVGAATVSQVTLYNTSPVINTGTAAGEFLGSPATLGGVLETPVLARANQTITIEEYTVTATTEYLMAVCGLVCEKAGKTIAV